MSTILNSAFSPHSVSLRAWLNSCNASLALFSYLCMCMMYEDVSLFERCPHFRGCYVQASMELGPEDVSLLDRCPHFRGCYVQASMELGPEDVSLLDRCLSVGVTMYVQAWNIKSLLHV